MSIRLLASPRHSMRRSATIVLVALAAVIGASWTRVDAGFVPAGEAATRDGTGDAPLSTGQFAHRLSADVYGYLPYWEIDAGTDAYLRYDYLSDIALFSIGFDAAGAISTSATGYPTVTGSTAATITAHAHAAGVRVDMTVTSFGYAKNSAFFANPGAMATAAANISALVQAEGLDGVNLDVESLYNEDFAAYGTFVGQIRTALRAWNPAARVSVATNGSVSGANMAVQALANGADRVFIMGYSYRTAGSSPAGSIAPLVRSGSLSSLTSTLDIYASKGIPASTLLLGLPYYGRTWSTTSGALHAPTTASGGVFIPSDDMDAIPPGTIVNTDPIEGARWFAIQDPVTSAWTQTYFDDPGTLRTKYDLANQRRLRGVGIWTLGYDRGISGYWDAIAASFGTIRLAGKDRYATAAAITADGFEPGVDAVYVASGAAYADALTAAAIAGGRHEPVLLVSQAVLPASTKAAIARLQPDHIVLVGGTGAVSEGVATALAALAPGGVQRIAGTDRYATAAAMSASGFPDGAPVVYLSSGAAIADAISAAPAAARDGGPVLLTSATQLPGATAAELERLAPSAVVVVGGPAVVGDAVLSAVDALLPGVTVTRLAGADRFATSAAVAGTFDADVPAIYVASGYAFADALTAAAAAGSSGAPVLLSAPTTLPAVIRTQILRLNPSRAIVAGGTMVVSDAVLRAVRDAVAAS